MFSMFSNRHSGRRVLLAGALTGCAFFCPGTLALFAQQPSPPPYKLVLDPASMTVYTGDKPVLRYRYAGVPFKPYVDLFYTPSGVNVLRDAVPDHKHHHGLMFALAVDSVDFWSETPVNGKEVHQGFNDVRAGKGRDVLYGGFVDAELAWVGPNGQAPLLFEDRRIETVRMKDQQASLLTWDSMLSLPEGTKTATLSGAEYFGLGMRFVPSMDKDGKFFNAGGKTGVPGTNAARAKWCAYSAAVNGKPVTVAVFDHPANPRQPATWFTMDKPFAYLAATLDLKNQPLAMQEDRPLLLRYGVALWDGEVDAQEVDGVYRRWLGLFQAPPGPGGPAVQGQQPKPPQAGPGGPSQPSRQATPAAPGR
jgi:hypothetical protein